uniref:Glucosamine-6-phosphate isomerase n=1 Tax=Arcella intermedia TaxID=1963864 RepID=A0A6B2LFM7_9EUKA
MNSADEVAEEAASQISTQIQSNPHTVLGLATGSTPTLTYSKLVQQHRASPQQLSFSGVTTFNLDEYWGLAGDHDQSYRYFMNQNLLEHVDIKLWNTHVLNGKAANPHLECKAFETKILASGGVDLWLLGIGPNGHIAFNEPGSSVDSRTRLVALSEETIAANSDGRFFKNAADVPRCALSAGIGTIREARKVVLLATGSKKADAVAAALEGPFSSNCPASYLQDHPNCVFIIDKEAAQKLKKFNQ